MKKFLRSFGFAAEGIKFCFKQTNFRVQVLCFVIAICLSAVLQISTVEIVLILFAGVLVLVVEMVNTAIEYLCNLYTNEFNQHIKIIKDVAAGAVLVASIIAFLTGCFIFLPKIIALF